MSSAKKPQQPKPLPARCADILNRLPALHANILDVPDPSDLLAPLTDRLQRAEESELGPKLLRLVETHHENLGEKERARLADILDVAAEHFYRCFGRRQEASLRGEWTEGLARDTEGAWEGFCLELVKFAKAFPRGDVNLAEILSIGGIVDEDQLTVPRHQRSPFHRSAASSSTSSASRASALRRDRSPLGQPYRGRYSYHSIESDPYLAGFDEPGSPPPRADDIPAHNHHRGTNAPANPRRAPEKRDTAYEEFAESSEDEDEAEEFDPDLPQYNSLYPPRAAAAAQPAASPNTTTTDGKKKPVFYPADEKPPLPPRSPRPPPEKDPAPPLPPRQDPLPAPPPAPTIVQNFHITSMPFPAPVPGYGGIYAPPTANPYAPQPIPAYHYSTQPPPGALPFYPPAPPPQPGPTMAHQSPKHGLRERAADALLRQLKPQAVCGCGVRHLGAHVRCGCCWGRGCR